MVELEKLENSKGKSSHGGPRPNAGRPKGKANQATIERAAIKRAFQDRIAKVVDKLFEAQMNLAMGVSYLYVIRKDPKGKQLPAEIVTDRHTIAAYIDGDLNHTTDDEWYFISTEKPDNRAIDSLLDRAFGKAEQNMTLKGDDENPVPILSLIGGDVPRDNSSKEDTQSQ